MKFFKNFLKIVFYSILKLLSVYEVFIISNRLFKLKHKKKKRRRIEKTLVIAIIVIQILKYNLIVLRYSVTLNYRGIKMSKVDFISIFLCPL